MAWLSHHIRQSLAQVYLVCKHTCKASCTSQRIFTLTLTACLFLIVGCDFTPGFEEFNQTEEEEIDENACRGDGILCNVAGIAGMEGTEGLGGSALTAQLSFPMDVEMAPITLAQTGEVYIVDANNHAIRKITPSGDLFPFIGTGLTGDGTDGDGDKVALNNPSEITVGPDGNFYVTDWKNSKVKIFDGITLKVIDTYGLTAGFAGDGGPASSATLAYPSSITFDPDGNLYIADQRNQRIRQIDLQSVISTYAGTDTGFENGIKEEAAFNFFDESSFIPGGKISINTHDWAMYIADTENNCIRRLNFFTNEITTVIGTGEAGYSGDGGNARNAQLNRPTDVIFREDHHIYIADSGNHVIRKVDPFGNITTIAGTGEAGFSPDATPGVSAQLNTPQGIYYDEVNHLLYIADTFNHQVKRIYDF